MAERILMNLIVFARMLRSAGIAVRAGGIPDAVGALEDIGFRRRRDVRDLLRAVLISRREDLAGFDEIFERFWRVWPASTGDKEPQPLRLPQRAKTTVRAFGVAVASDQSHEEKPAQTDASVALGTYSPGQIWRRKDFATFTIDDVARAKHAMARLAWNPAVRVTRRWIAGSGPSIDLRRLLRANARHGGEWLAIPLRVRRVAPRPLVLICDVSGSMEPYTRMLLLFAHALAGGDRRVEVFVFSTRLTRVTRLFAETRVDAALTKVRNGVDDWSGGTRIGDAIRAFNVHWARRVLRRSPVVLLISDGWDLGSPDVMRREMARLQRSSFRLIWLNPLLGSPGYEPLTRGMRAALPFVDDFLPVHDMSSLDALAARLGTLSRHRPARRSQTTLQGSTRWN